jgi:hypothetical protein
VFKFAVYLSIPVVMTVAFAASPENLQKIIANVRGATPGAHSAAAS